MVPLFTDEDIPRGVVDELIRSGFDVLTAQIAGLANFRRPDSDLLSFSTSVGRAIVTHNRRHFIRLHSRQQPHAGIVVCTRDDDNPLALAQRIAGAIRNAGSLANQLVRVNRPASPQRSP